MLVSACQCTLARNDCDVASLPQEDLSFCTKHQTFRRKSIRTMPLAPVHCCDLLRLKKSWLNFLSYSPTLFISFQSFYKIRFGSWFRHPATTWQSPFLLLAVKFCSKWACRACCGETQSTSTSLTNQQVNILPKIFAMLVAAGDYLRRRDKNGRYQRRPQDPWRLWQS